MKFETVLIGLLFLVTGYPAAAEEGSADVVPVRQVGALEAIIPPEVKDLHMENPLVEFWVLVTPKGEIKDFLAISATHHLLLERGEATLQKAKFTPAQRNGQPVIGKITVTVTFYSPEQRMWKQGLAPMPMGGSAFEGVRRKLYEGKKAAEVYSESTPEQLDSPLTLVKAKLCNVHPPGEEMQTGRVLVEYYVDREGKVRLPRIVESDGEYLSLSALMTLKETQFAPPKRDGRPTFVRVRQPFNFN